MGVAMTIREADTSLYWKCSNILRGHGFTVAPTVATELLDTIARTNPNTRLAKLALGNGESIWKEGQDARVINIA
jgi:hypothetical protein